MSTGCSSSPVIGSGAFFPQGKFAAPRAYFKTFTVEQAIWIVSRVDNVITLTNPLVFWDTLVVVIDQRFYEWNSNGWTLDHIICECYFHNLLTDGKTAEAYSLLYSDVVSIGENGLIFNPSGFGTGGLVTFDLPPGDPAYWTPA